jgi:hypothetical protein
MREANELFSMIDGVKSDAELHEGILAGGDEVSAFTSTLEVLRNNGYSEDEIVALYGPLYERWKARFA